MENKVEEKNNIVVNDSKGYGYNYASLSDIAKQGYKIPKMKIDTDENTHKDYFYYYDEEFKQWLRGAEIVIPESKSMNKAQLYGSALTYARRYTTLIALQLATDDDKDIEDLNKDGTKKDSKKATEKQVNFIKNLGDENVAKILSHFKIDKLEDLTLDQASSVIKEVKK